MHSLVRKQVEGEKVQQQAHLLMLDETQKSET